MVFNSERIPAFRLLFLCLPLLGMTNTCNFSSSEQDRGIPQTNDVPGKSPFLPLEQSCIGECKIPYKISDIGSPQIKVALQKRFFTKILQSKGYVEGYALFSYGGWSDKGQIMVMRRSQNTGGDIIYIRPNSEKEEGTKTFVRADLDNLVNQLNVKGLSDFKPKVFDGIEYEYVHVVLRGNSTLEVVARVYMRVPSLSKDKPNRYLQIVDAFTSLLHKFHK